MTQLHIATLNIQRIVSCERILQVIDFVRHKNFDIVALQEVCFARLPTSVRDYKLHSNLSPAGSGTALLCKSSLNLTVLTAAASGRIMICRIGSLAILNVYAPSGNSHARERKLFFRNTLVPYLSGLGRAVMLGDFNAVTRVADRNENGAPVGKPDADLKSVVASFELTDVWLELRTTACGHTRRGPNSSARLDHIYIAKEALSAVSKVTCQTVSFSDHSCLDCVLSVPDLPPVQPSTRNKNWKLNRAVLSENEYVEKINCFLKSARRHPLYRTDVCLWWDNIIKPGIKRVSIHYCRQRTRWMRATNAFYESCLADLAGSPNNDSSNREVYDAIQGAAHQQRSRLHEGMLIRARLPSSVPGEQLSIYHVTRERRMQRAATISSLNTSDGESVTEDTALCNIIETHYTNLLGQTISTEREQEDFFLSQVQRSPFSNAESDNLLAPFTTLELQSALNAARNGKSPGADGIPLEFYKVFWNEIASDLVTIFNEIVRRGSLTDSQKQALIRLIPKNSDPKVIEDYRPIALLCVDYKLLASLFKRRLDSTLDKVISQHQRGGISGRRTEDILLAVRNLLLLLQEKESGGLLVALDFNKAFDRVNRSTLWKTMVAMGYPPVLTDRLEALYIGTTSVISYGVGRQTAPISCVSSIRQGCPLSVTLFILYMDPLLRALDSGINGIRGVPRPVKLCGLVDDITVFAGTVEDLYAIGHIVRRFCDWTGAQLNSSKTKQLILGSWRTWLDRVPNEDPFECSEAERRGKMLKVTWATIACEVRLLGLTFTHDHDSLAAVNWTKLLNKMTAALAASKTRTLTLHQRARFVNQHVLSLGAHAAKILSCPKSITKKLTSRVLAFIWEGTNLRVAQEAIYRPEKAGGLGLLCPAEFFKALYLKSNLAPLLLDIGIPFTRDCMRYWLGFSLRTILPKLYERSRPNKFLEQHNDIQNLASNVRDLHQKGTTVTPEILRKGRHLYATLVCPTLRPGNVEIAHPLLDWNAAWKHVHRLPMPLRDFMFRVNHNVLHTRERTHRIGKTASPACGACGEIETLEHVFWWCPARRVHIRNIMPSLERLGVATLPRLQLTHLALPNGMTTHAARILSETYQATWSARLQDSALQNGTGGSINEIEDPSIPHHSKH